MERHFKVCVNGEFEFSFSEKELEELDTLQLSDHSYHLLQGQKSFHAEITDCDFLKRNYAVQINSNDYKVQISNELDQLIKGMGLSAAVSKEVKDIKAPMPGLILEVSIDVGKKVVEGDYLMVLEAMKMENTITAPRNGIVKKVNVKKGETVEKSQLLIEME